MQFSSNIFLVISLLFSTSVIADVKLSVGDNISLLAVNGSEVETDSFFTNARTAKLPNGRNQILVQYSAEIKSSGSYDIEDTDAHVLVFDIQDKTVSLLAPEIDSLAGLRRFNSGKHWLLKDSSGNSIEYKSQPLIKEGIQLNRDYERELQDFNRSGGELSIQSDRSISDIYSHVKDSNNNTSPINLPETLLRYWYLKADAETRNRFKSWAGEQ